MKALQINQQRLVIDEEMVEHSYRGALREQWCSLLFRWGKSIEQLKQRWVHFAEVVKTLPDAAQESRCKEAVQIAIVRGELVGAVACLHPSPGAEFRFAPESALHPDLFLSRVLSDKTTGFDYLWIKREALQRVLTKASVSLPPWLDLLEEAPPVIIPKHGRRPGENWRIEDEPFLAQMKVLVDSHGKVSAAAAQVAKDAPGANTEVASKTDRLRKAFREA